AEWYEDANKPDKALEEHIKISHLYPESNYWAIRSNLRAAGIFASKQQWDMACKFYGKVVKTGTEESKFAAERIKIIKERQ
ncbi:MAG: hypothetical protein KAX15_00395, partial [Candidatus Omnitrophica bacterium]|nr:hypothetical protein [Candidatus Omnitrophota bacterium]